MGTAFAGVVSRNGDGVSVGGAFPKRCANFGNENVNIFNNGLEFPYVDLGRGGVTGAAADNGKFKVPSLRNIERTAPYMHDGRFATLDQVVEFYSTGVVDNPNLSPPLRLPPQQGGGVRRPNFTATQKADLVAFLKTLTDTSVTTDVKFSDPFNYGN